MLFFSSTVRAQTPTASDTTAHLHGKTLTLGAMAIGVLTRAAPAYDGKMFTEFQVTQPMLSIGLSRSSLTFSGLLNAEGYTLKRGELNAGIYGEGYVDRRHPHTLVHEAMLTWLPRSPQQVQHTTLSISVSAGRGFVPFGSDDPMMRPFEKYPVNHHHSQILERIQTIAAAEINRGSQSFAIELAAFNGDEPAGPFHGPRWNRFGDSWAVRGTLRPLERVELSLSEASVVSPELQQGGAFNHRQHHAALRIDAAAAAPGSRYLLAEWARTDERIDGQTAFQYQTFLAEGAYGWRGALAAARIERTDRGEQRRLADPFRTPVGHVDFQILGVTQWTVSTIAIQSPSLQIPSLVRLAPFLEVSRAVAAPRARPSAFEAAAFYGDDRLWSVSLGIRLHAGTMRHRMGRYGVMSGVDHTGIQHHAR